MILEVVFIKNVRFAFSCYLPTFHACSWEVFMLLLYAFSKNCFVMEEYVLIFNS